MRLHRKPAPAASYPGAKRWRQRESTRYSMPLTTRRTPLRALASLTASSRIGRPTLLIASGTFTRLASHGGRSGVKLEGAGGGRQHHHLAESFVVGSLHDGSEDV